MRAILIITIAKLLYCNDDDGMWCKVYFMKDRKKKRYKILRYFKRYDLIASNLIRKGVDVIANIKFSSWSS